VELVSAEAQATDDGDRRPGSLRCCQGDPRSCCTCHMNGVSPLAYLTDVIEKLQNGWPKARFDEILPDRFAPRPHALSAQPRPRHTIAPAGSVSEVPHAA
jgi:hypothetical protein